MDKTYRILIKDPDGNDIFNGSISKDEIEIHTTTKAQRIKRIADKIVHIIMKTGE